MQRAAGCALTAAGLYVPQRTYSFLWNNPLTRTVGSLVPDLTDWVRLNDELILFAADGVYAVGPVNGETPRRISASLGCE